MVDAINSQGRVYSSDKKIYSGMEVKEAANSLEAIRIFNYADMNDNGKIDEVELSRYDGPVIQYDENIEQPKIKAQNDLSAAKYELYTGLKIGDIPKEFREEFFYTDINNDGELSLAEMIRKQIKVETGIDVEISEDMSKEDLKQLVIDKRIEKDMNDIKKIMEKGNKSSLQIGCEIIGKSFLGAGFGGLAGSAIAADITGTSACVGGLLGATVGGVLLCGIGLYGFDIRRDARADAAKLIAKLEQDHGDSPEVKAEIEQLRKDNPWLANFKV